MEDYGSGQMTRANLSQWALDNISIIINRNWLKANGFITDINSMMQAVWESSLKRDI
jgi:transketolase N-terminal domain/subunit